MTTKDQQRLIDMLHDGTYEILATYDGLDRLSWGNQSKLPDLDRAPYAQTLDGFAGYKKYQLNADSGSEVLIYGLSKEHMQAVLNAVHEVGNPNLSYLEAYEPVYLKALDKAGESERMPRYLTACFKELSEAEPVRQKFKQLTKWVKEYVEEFNVLNPSEKHKLMVLEGDKADSWTGADLAVVSDWDREDTFAVWKDSGCDYDELSSSPQACRAKLNDFTSKALSGINLPTITPKAPYSNMDYKLAQSHGLDLDNYSDYERFYGLGEQADPTTPSLAEAGREARQASQALTDDTSTPSPLKEGQEL